MIWLIVVLSLITLLVFYLAIGMLHINSRWFGPIHFRGDPSRRAVALTFDDGPNHPSTDRILDILKRENVRATFFVIGLNASVAPELLRRIDAEGHQIANHSFDHHHVGFLRGPLYWFRQIAATNAIIENAIGRRPAMFRPPIGMKSPAIAWAARHFGQTIMLWSVRTLDGVTRDPADVIAAVARGVKPGDVIVLHDGIDPHRWRDPAGTIEALPRIIQMLREQNLECIRLDELFDLPAYIDRH